MDERIKEGPHKRQMFFQILSAICFMWLVLHILDEIATSRVLWAAGASSLASSAYIVFCMPHSDSASLYRLLPAYVVALLVGLGMRYFIHDACQLLPHCDLNTPHLGLFEIATALSLGLSLWMMILVKAKHPPAAGLAVVMTLDVHSFSVIVIMLLSALFLGIIRTVFYNRLHDLI